MEDTLFSYVDRLHGDEQFDHAIRLNDRIVCVIFLPLPRSVSLKGANFMDLTYIMFTKHIETVPCPALPRMGCASKSIYARPLRG
jgi:hypothetical protein